MNEIHSTAIVHPKAKLGDNIEVGPFTVIEEDVEIGDGTKIGSHAGIYNGARIGKNVKIFQGASISNYPQDLKFAGEQTFFFVGDNTTIREFVTLHKGTTATGKSSLGSNCLLMAYTHIAHDCHIGDNCILANAVQIGGHVHIDDFVIIGGSTPVHQFSKIGMHAMIGGGFRVTVDIPPYVLAGGEPLRYSGLNVIGLRRRGFSNEEIAIMKNAYSIIFGKELNFSDALKKVKELYPNSLVINNILKFFEDSTRAILKR